MTGRSRTAGALILALVLSLLAPTAAQASREEYDRGYRHGYDACPDTQVRPNPGNLPSDYFAGWVAGCIDAMLNKRKPQTPINGGGPTYDGSGIILPGMISPGIVSGRMFYRSNRWTGSYWTVDTSVSGINLADTTPFQGTGGMTLQRNYTLQLKGQAIEIPVFTYTNAAGQTKVFSSGTLGSVSPDGRRALVSVVEGTKERLYVADLPQGAGCTQAAPCSNVTMREIPGITWKMTGVRASWSQDSRKVAFTDIEPYWERSGWIADTSGPTVTVENLYDRFAPFKCFFGTYNGGRNEVWDFCRHSDLKFSPDGKRLLIVDPTGQMKAYDYPFTGQDWMARATTILEVPKRQRIENATWSPDGKWIAYVRRICGGDSQDQEGRPEPCGWFYGKPTGYIGVINVETKKEYQITPVTQMPAGAVADLVWIEGAAPAPPDPVQDPISAPFAMNFQIKTENGQRYLEAQSLAPGKATLSFRLRSSTGVPYTVQGPTAETGQVARVKLPALADDTYQIDAFARLDNGRTLSQISAGAVTISATKDSAQDLQGPPKSDGSTPIDPITGQPIDRTLSKEPGVWVSKPIDPVTGGQVGLDGPAQQVREIQAPGIDPVTGNPVAGVIAKPVDPVSGKPIDPITGQPIPIQVAEGIELWGGARLLTPDGQAQGLDLFVARTIPGFSVSLIGTHLAKVPEVYRAAEVKAYQSTEIPVHTAAEVKAHQSQEVGFHKGDEVKPWQPGGGDQPQPQPQPDSAWGLTAASSGGRAKISWKAQSGATKGYYLYRAERSGGQTRTPATDFPVEGTSYTDPNTEPGKTYYYVVRPVLANDAQGPASPEIAISVTSVRRKVISLVLDETTATVDGAAVKLDVPPQLIGERTMVPFRFLGTALGAELIWDGAARKVTYSLNGVEIVLWVDKTTALVKGVEKRLDVAPTIVGSRLLIPLRFASENLGAGIKFDGRTRSIEITYPGP